MIFKRTNSIDPDFKLLVVKLDQNLVEINGDIQQEYDQHNLLEFIETVVVAYENNLPVGCGCFKKYDETTVEIKRMYTLPAMRGRGAAFGVLNELEKWAIALGYAAAVLETGLKHHEAISLYHKLGYSNTEKYGPYVNMADSVCMRKELNRD